ncbi:hypothetical protein ACQ4LE_001173 [Meloidogyne hapla]
MDKEGYPTYARPKNGRTANVGGKIVDNRWVVPHNLYLLKNYDCHINFEYVHNIKSVKYLYKYIHKGHDKAEIEIIENEGKNEIKEYQDVRYVTPPDALWRILGYEMQERSHTIKRLPIHLSGKQTVFIDKKWSEEHIKNKMEKKTELTAYFELNKTNEKAIKLLYHEIPEYFVFKNGEWVERKSHFNTIGRIHFIRPSNMELYCLRLLLCHIKGATCFEDLRKVNNFLCSTFQETCVLLGLIKDDQEWVWCLNEAKEFAMPKQIRILFARIIVHCHPSKPMKLWEQFKMEMSEDFLHSFPENIAFNKAYKDIAKLLIDEGKSLKEIPEMHYIDIDEEDDESFNPIEEKAKGEIGYVKLNNEQKIIIDQIIEKLENIQQRPALLFLNGAGGYGKTFTYEVAIHLVRGLNKSVTVMAPTGIAATLLPGGRTVHNRFILDLKLTRSLINKSQKEWKELKGSEVFIIDEAPMLNKNALEIINEKLQEITENNGLFGNKIIVAGGDFRQTLPIQKYATRTQLIDLSIKKSHLWKFFEEFKLAKNMRTHESEIDFSTFLLDLGDGKLNNENDEVILPSHCVTYEDLIEPIFGDIIDSKNYNELSKRAILAPLNIDVDFINEQVLNLVEGDEKIFKSVDNAENENGSDYAPEYLNTLYSSGLPKHELKLKEKIIVMLLRNLNIKAGLCNGTRLSIEKMGERILECKIITGEKIGEKVLIPRISLIEDENYPFTLIRHQFPLKLAFCLTINKSQGQKFELIGIDLRNNVFQHGQLYTGFSRTRSWKGLLVRLNPENKERKVKNIVYKEIFE